MRRNCETATQAPARFNWFFRSDPQVELAYGRRDHFFRAFPDLIASLERAADLAGIHPHFWRWDPRHSRWFNDFSEDWQQECLAASIDGFRETFGHVPLASRGGDRWSSNAAIRCLRGAGLRYDLSIEPGIPSLPLWDDPYATAWLPDYRSAPRSPYRPSPGDYLTPDPSSTDRPFWMVPVTTSRETFWIRRRRYPFLCRASRALNLVMHPENTGRYIEQELDRTTPDPLVLVLRTGDLATPAYAEAFRSVAGRMLRHAALAACQFMRVDEAL